MIRETRLRFKQPTVEEYTEYLYREVKRIYDEKHKEDSPLFNPLKKIGV